MERLRTTDRRGGFHRHAGAAIGLFPGRGWTLTLFVGDTGRYAPARFLVLLRMDGALRGELLSEPEAGSGELRQVNLEGASLDGYLERARLDLTGLDAVFTARWGAPRAGK